MSRCSFRAWMALLFLGQALAGWPCAAHAQQGNLTDFLFFVQHVPAADECEITLKSAGDPPQVMTSVPNGRKKSWFVEVGKTFYTGGRFTPTKFEKKETITPDGVNKDVSELTLVDNLRKNQMVLIMNVPAHFPTTSEAVLEWRRNTTETIKVEEGTEFRMPGGSDALYRLIRIQEDSATIGPVLPNGSTGREIIIKRWSARAHRSG